ncbi:sugar ABC transporter permease [Ruminococcus sp. AF42-9BH]|nr:sugar ABC transporter permease [Ruminococcus sp. AF42-9BH]
MLKKRKTEAISKLERKNYKWIYLFLLPSILIFLVFYLQPIITVFYTSFTKWDGFNSPTFIGIQNYITMFKNEAFLISLKNIILWSVIAATLHVGFGVLVAFILYQKPKGWKFTRAVFMIPNVISAAAWAMIYKFIFNDDMGILNNIIRKIDPDFHVQWFYTSPYAFWAVTLTWLFYAVIVTLIVLNDLMAVPEELTEAAKVDGATGWQVITKIQLPLCRNAIGTGVICSITARVAMYEQIALTTAGGPGDDTMNLPIILVKSIQDMKYGYANANGVIMFVLGLITLAIVNKAFRMNESVY